MLAYSRVGRGPLRKAPLDLGRPVEHALRNLSLVIQERNAVVEVDPLPVALAEETLMTVLFQNLISNALKFHSGGTAPLVRIRASQAGGMTRIEIQDNGIGIEPRHHERIFVIFQRLNDRRQFPGAGIGLAICKKIVELHGGVIGVESQQGTGATFYFTIPQLQKEGGNNP